MRGGQRQLDPLAGMEHPTSQPGRPRPGKAGDWQQATPRGARQRPGPQAAPTSQCGPAGQGQRWRGGGHHRCDCGPAGCGSREGLERAAGAEFCSPLLAHLCHPSPREKAHPPLTLSLKEVNVSVAQSCPTLCHLVDGSLPGSSIQEYWSGLPCPPSGDLPDPGIEPRCPALQSDSLLSEPLRKP